MDFHPEEVADVVVVGNGPSALILSYILHGNIPRYVGGCKDHRLDEKLRRAPDLTRIAPSIYNYFSTHQSSQALPINALVDSLIRPNGETDLLSKSCVEWYNDPARVISHVVLGNAPHAGGQWVDNPVKASWDIGTLSYAEQLGLPGYSVGEYWRDAKHEPLPDMIRLTRNDVTDYLKAYPAAVGIEKTLRTSVNVTSISRQNKGFYVEPSGIYCKHIVLATGIFNINLPPPRYLSPLVSLTSRETGVVLVIGSGFTAADIMISTPPSCKIIHLFNWDPVNRPSPLKACHGSAYPEYAYIYRQMKLAANRLKNKGKQQGSAAASSTRAPPNSSTAYFNQRDWAATYEGFANSRISGISIDDDEKPSSDILNGDSPRGLSSNGGTLRHATVQIKSTYFEATVDRTITAFRHAAGRRGSLSYLAPPLRAEVLPEWHDAINGHSHRENVETPNHSDLAAQGVSESSLISRLSLRDRIVASTDAAINDDQAAGLELAPSVFVVGSLTGDSLIRYAYGGCAATAGAIAARGSLDFDGAFHEPRYAQLDRRKD